MILIMIDGGGGGGGGVDGGWVGGGWRVGGGGTASPEGQWINCDILLQVHAVIVCTIRDHAYRVKSLYKELAKEMPEVIIADCIGGNGYMKDLRKAMSTLKPNIIVGTIGRIDTLNKKMRFLQDVRFLVCEEMGLITKYPCKFSWYGLHHQIL